MSNHKPGHHEHAHHVTPMGVYIKVFAALITLTIITVWTSYYDLGALGNIALALFIASIKATLVLLFFMQLKYDDKMNGVAIAMSFFFLFIFISITASDLFFRDKPQPVKVQEDTSQMQAKGGDQNKLRVSTPELMAKGKASYATNCAMCHGDAGKGDGAAAAALNPKPRDFTSGVWKFGGAPTRVFKTLTVGSPGTSMAPYGHLSVEERYALVHYIRSFHDKNPADTEADLKAAGLLGGAAAMAADKPKVEIPIEVAMVKISDPDQVIIPSEKSKEISSAGGKIYQHQCLNCHGINGVGGAVKAVGVNPKVNIITKSFVGTNASWASSESEFMRVVSYGIPGKGMPGYANFSKQEWSELFSYVKSLTH